MINESGVSAPYKKLGSWLARAKNTVYQAATDGFVCAYDSDNDNGIDVSTDNSNPPVSKRTAGFAGNGYVEGICCPVKKGDYWKVACITDVDYVFWIPLEP